MKKIFSSTSPETSLSIVIFLLRAAAGAMMIPHGYDKLTKFAEYAPGFSDPFHIGRSLSLALLIFAEFFCSMFLIVGLLTRMACIPLIIGMSVALFYSHHGDLFGDGQLAALFLTIFIAIFFMGPGKLSMDRMISK
ncbi:MAG: DoxX family protein [Bacteroidota bacterium]|nr:DoxX family protein [Bacteroidota bacterium]